jgi:hypothetical protein
LVFLVSFPSSITNASEYSNVNLHTLTSHTRSS